MLQPKHGEYSFESSRAELFNDMEINVEETCSWGWWKFKPKCLQFLNSPKWFVFFMATFSTFQGMTVNGFTSAAIPTLEKRFKFNSKETGFITASNDIAALLLLLFVSFYGSYGHKTRWIGIGALVTALGCFMFVLPQAMIGKYDIPEGIPSSNRSGLCSTTNITGSEDSSCSATGTPYQVYLFVFVLSELFMGAGTSPLFSLGPTFLDDNINPQSLPVYLGVFYVSILMGPGIGYLVAGQLLSLFVDIKLPEGVTLSTKDPRWLGCWWIGPLLSGVVLLFASLMLLAYPRELPGTKSLRDEAMARGELLPSDSKIKGKLKDIIPASRKLAINATFVTQTFAVTFGNFAGLAISPFMFKIIQNHYGASQKVTGLSIAILTIPGAGGGLLLGSFIVKRFKLKESCKQAAKWCFILQFIAIWTGFIFFIPGCNNSTIAGVTKQYSNSSEMSLLSTCNSKCGCSGTYIPVCGSDHVTYYSACHAGCTDKISKMNYSDCACISSSSGPSYATQGMCDRNCKNLIPFIVGAAVLLIFNTIADVPSKIVTMRCVSDNQRAYALGLQMLVMKALGYLPGPVLFGNFIDNSCRLMSSKCSGRKYCLDYDYVDLSKVIVTMAIISLTLACVLFGLSWFSTRKLKIESLTNEPSKQTAAAELTNCQNHDEKPSENGFNLNGAVLTEPNHDEIDDILTPKINTADSMNGVSVIKVSSF